MKDSPERKAKVLEEIKRYVAEKGYGPSVEDVRRLAGLTSKSVASYYVNALLAEGKITHTPGVARSIRIVEEVAA